MRLCSKPLYLIPLFDDPLLPILKKSSLYFIFSLIFHPIFIVSLHHLLLYDIFKGFLSIKYIKPAFFEVFPKAVVFPEAVNSQMEEVILV
jgi:hypothetical protein